MQFCVEQRDANKADVVVLGCSGWLRHLPAREGFESEEAKSRLRQAVDGLVSELENKDFTIERLTEQHEGFFEAAAVAYGYARRKMPRDLDDTLSDEEIRVSYLPTAYLSSGGSSCRVALAMRCVELVFAVLRGVTEIHWHLLPLILRIAAKVLN